MDRKTELKQLYKEIKPEPGVYQIKNLKNGKILVESTMNLKTMNGRRMELGLGNHPNKSLARELKEFGPDAFALEILEILETKEDGLFTTRDAVKDLKNKWLDKLHPFGERGYNSVNERT
jgi:hypothetical protein